MTRPLDLFARRVESNPWFLASAMAVYAQSEGLNDERLASTLGCSVADLTCLRLCRRPLSEPYEAFRRDIDALVRAYGVHADIMADVARRADAVDKLRGSKSGIAEKHNALIAARDRERDDLRHSDRENTPTESRSESGPNLNEDDERNEDNER